VLSSTLPPQTPSKPLTRLSQKTHSKPTFIKFINFSWFFMIFHDFYMISNDPSSSFYHFSWFHDWSDIFSQDFMITFHDFSWLFIIFHDPDQSLLPGSILDITPVLLLLKSHINTESHLTTSLFYWFFMISRLKWPPFSKPYDHFLTIFHDFSWLFINFS
jgi:hypothetical protein